MAKHIAVLRGINVGGKRIIRMDDLRTLFNSLGFEEVQTYIQSGNVIFNAREETDEIVLGNKIEIAILDKFGFEVPVIVRTSDDLLKAVNENPFLKNDPGTTEHLHLTLLKNIPGEENILETESYHFEPDHFIITGNNVYLHIEGKYHATKLSNNFFEKKLKVAATTRNWNTILKLIELSQ